MPKVTIDGKTVTVNEGDTLLAAAHKADIWIPTLCHHPALQPLAACRICMVELDRGGWTQLVTACNYPVRKDLSFSVSSERAVKARRGVMMLLLARSPESAELKELASRMGVEKTIYPKVTESQRNCILCGLCVKVCEEVIGCEAISFVGRAVNRAVAPPFRLVAEDCIACGACAAICPVGTIQIRTYEEEGEMEISPFKARVKMLTCKKCGKNFSSSKTMQSIKDRVKIHLNSDVYDSCPDCRRVSKLKY